MSIKTINGYKIMLEEVLGHGAYGTVYRGQQDATKLPCAIKIIQKKAICKDPYLKSALDSEIQILSKIKSRNIVGFYDVLMSSHNYYIIQELCEGDLESYLDKNKKNITEQQAIKFLTEICNGFMTLVKQGIVHRDLKPANILICKGQLKIGDFGFAKANVHKRVKNESCVGTPLYMSIEVLKCLGYTSKCDIWSIGCIFYEILHGNTPWTAKSQYQLVQNISQKPLNLNSNLSQSTKDFLKKTLQTREQERLCWDQLFRHPIFKGYFDEFTNQHSELENKYKKVMSDLRFKVNSQNIDLEQLWSNLGFQQNKQINFQQFQAFLEAVNPRMIKWQQIYFFEKLDPHGNGSVNLEHLCKQLQKNSISTTSRHKQKIPLSIKKVNTMSVDVEQSKQAKGNWDEQFSRRVQACFEKLYKIIKTKGLTLYKTFLVYDKDSNGRLTVEQFSKIIKKLDPSFTLEQIESIFNVIDENNSKTIEFSQFNSYFCKVNRIPLGLQNQKQIKNG